MAIPLRRCGAVLFVGALLACATPGALGTGGAGFGLEAGSPPERIDACAGALIALRGASEDLRTELDETRRRKLVWRGERDTVFGSSKHQVDWNPALDHLATTLDE